MNTGGTYGRIAAPLLACALTPISATEAEQWALWILAAGDPPPEPGDLTTAVAQCADTFAWAARKHECWFWASDPAIGADVRPPSRESLLELRAFGPNREILLWTDRPGGTLRGRTIADVPATRPEHAPIDRRMRFDQRESGPETLGPGAPFVLRRSTGGRITVTPPGDVLVMRNYLAESPHTGLLRIAASRFVEFQ